MRKKALKQSLSLANYFAKFKISEFWIKYQAQNGGYALEAILEQPLHYDKLIDIFANKSKANGDGFELKEIYKDASISAESYYKKRVDFLQSNGNNSCNVGRRAYNGGSSDITHIIIEG